jgi:hypothetical protein
LVTARSPLCCFAGLAEHDEQLAALGLVPYRAPNVPVVTQAQIEALREAEGV